MCRIVTFVSAAGGVGQTSIIKKLADSLSGLGHRVCLIDAHFGLNDLSLRFLEKRERSGDSVELDKLTDFDLKDYLSGEHYCAGDIPTRQGRGVWVVRSNCAEFDYTVHLELFVAFVKQLADDFDFVLIDSNSFSFRALELALLPATEIILILSDYEAHVLNGARLIKKIKSVNHCAECLLLLNKVHPALAASNIYLNETEIGELLKCRVLFSFPLFYKYNIFSDKFELQKRGADFNKHREKIGGIFFEFVRSFVEWRNCKSSTFNFKGLFGLVRKRHRAKFEW